MATSPISIVQHISKPTAAARAIIMMVFLCPAVALLGYIINCLKQLPHSLLGPFRISGNCTCRG